MAFTITAGPRGFPAGFGETRQSFGDALTVAMEMYDKGYQVQIANQRTQEVFTETQLLQARDRMRKAAQRA